MDHDRFDQLTKLMATKPNRRSAVRLLTAGALGGLLSRLGLEEAAAGCAGATTGCTTNDGCASCANTVCQAGKCCRPAGKGCTKGSHCCSGRCNRKKKRCKPCPTGTDPCGGQCVDAGTCGDTCEAQGKKQCPDGSCRECCVDTDCCPPDGIYRNLCLERRTPPPWQGCDAGTCVCNDSTYSLKCAAMPGTCNECCTSDDCVAKFSDPNRICNLQNGFGMCQCDIGAGYKLCPDSTGKMRCLNVMNDPENCGKCKWDGGDCRIFFNKTTCENGVCK